MFEIIVVIIVVLLALVLGGWISHQRNQRMANAFEKELERADHHERDSFQQRFDAVLGDVEDAAARSNSHAEPYFAAESDTADADTFADENSLPEQPDPVQQKTEPEPEWDLVIALTVLAQNEQLFTGRAIKNALDKHELRFGDMQIYHRYVGNNRQQSMFSVANIIAPGTFLPSEMIAMKTPGILLFARLPGPINGMAIFDAMLDTAQSIAEQLNGIVCDEQRQVLTEKTLENLRSQIFELNLSLQKERTHYDDLS